MVADLSDRRRPDDRPARRIDRHPWRRGVQRIGQRIARIRVARSYLEGVHLTGCAVPGGIGENPGIIKSRGSRGRTKDDVFPQCRNEAVGTRK